MHVLYKSLTILVKKESDEINNVSDQLLELIKFFKNIEHKGE